MIESALALSVLALAGTLASLLRSAPARLLRDSREARECADHVESEWHAERVRLQTFKSECAAALEGIQKERKRVNQAEVRARGNGTQGEGGEDLSSMTADQIRAHYTRLARERGWLS